MDATEEGPWRHGWSSLHGVEMPGGRRQLAQVAVVAEPHEFATIEQARDGQLRVRPVVPATKLEELLIAMPRVRPTSSDAQARGDACGSSNSVASTVRARPV